MKISKKAEKITRIQKPGVRRKQVKGFDIDYLFFFVLNTPWFVFILCA